MITHRSTPWHLLVTPGGRAKLHELIAEEEATMRLAAITAPSGHHAALAEVRRRVELGMSYFAATESVTDDVAAGRWKPTDQDTGEIEIESEATDATL